MQQQHVLDGETSAVPSTTPRIEPRPPVSAAPPITQAAMDCSSMPRPPPGWIEPTRVAASTPAKAAMMPAMAKAMVLVRSGLMPIATAALRLPPTAKKWLPSCGGAAANRTRRPSPRTR